MKLTKRQREVLMTMAGLYHDNYEQTVHVYRRGAALVFRYEPWGAWVHRAIIVSLRNRGLIEPIGVEPEACYYRIIPAGRKALEDARGD